jgi:hypothetical protein
MNKTNTDKPVKKDGRGGKREGAGRKTTNPKPYAMRLSEAEKRVIDEMRAKKPL